MDTIPLRGSKDGRERDAQVGEVTKRLRASFRFSLKAKQDRWWVFFVPGPQRNGNQTGGRDAGGSSGLNAESGDLLALPSVEDTENLLLR